jgi:hypothetical protein
MAGRSGLDSKPSLCNEGGQVTAPGALPVSAVCPALGAKLGAIHPGRVWTAVDGCGRRLEIYGSERLGIRVLPGVLKNPPQLQGDSSSRGGNSALNVEVLWEPFSGAIRVRSVQDEAATGSFYRAPWPSPPAMTTIS